MKTGDEILAYCGSCKMDLSATIIAKVGSKIAKVLCRTCKKERAYKAPKGITDPAESPTSTQKTTEKSEAKTVPIFAEWKKLMNDSKKSKPIAYSPKQKLQLGDLVDHGKFGQGIVIKAIYPDKAQIIFQDDIRTLIHSK